jgi:hypothetical protein
MNTSMRPAHVPPSRDKGGAPPPHRVLWRHMVCRAALPTQGLWVCVLPCVLLCVGATGCSEFQEAKFNKGLGVGADPVLVIPFREAKNGQWYGESPRGDRVAEAAKTWAMTNAEPNLVEGPQIDDALRVIRDWREEEITNQNLKQIFKSIEVTYVVLGEIETLSLTKPGTLGILDASVLYSYRVVKVETGVTVWSRKHATLSLTDGREIEAPIPEVGADTQVVEIKLLNRLGRQIGRDLYGYDPSES